MTPVAVVLIAIALSVLVLFQVRYLNGAPHWQWEWRRLPPWQWYPAMLLAAAPVFVGIALHLTNRLGIAVSVLLLMLGAVCLKLASVFVLPPPSGLSFMAEVVDSPEATSYYTDAAALANYPGWFQIYDQVLSTTTLHTRSKPPGPLLYWYGMIQMLGFDRQAAIVGGILQGLLATLSVPAVFWMARLLSEDHDAAFLAAAMLSLCPGFVLFFPMFDPIYPAIACAMIGAWFLATTRDSIAWSVLFGAAVFFASFVAYPLLSLGTFLLPLGLLSGARSGRETSMVTLRQGLLAISICAAAYGVLWYFTGFDPIATFRSAWHNQQQFLAQHESDRIWPATIPWDLLDFALGAGWLPVVLGVMYLVKTIRRHSSAPRHRSLVLLCLAQPVIVAMSGLVQSETARVWSFMFPLLLLPAALELRTWSIPARIICYACLWLLLTVVGQNMTFVNPGL